MALQKQKVLANGSSGNYWKIISIDCDRMSSKLHCQIALFMSADQRNGANLGAIKLFSFSVTKDQQEGNLLSLAYSLIKAKANSQVTRDINGQPCSPRPFDADLANSEDI